MKIHSLLLLLLPYLFIYEPELKGKWNMIEYTDGSLGKTIRKHPDVEKRRYDTLTVFFVQTDSMVIFCGSSSPNSFVGKFTLNDGKISTARIGATRAGEISQLGRFFYSNINQANDLKIVNDTLTIYSYNFQNLMRFTQIDSNQHTTEECTEKIIFELLK